MVASVAMALEAKYLIGMFPSFDMSGEYDIATTFCNGLKSNKKNVNYCKYLVGTYGLGLG